MNKKVLNVPKDPYATDEEEALLRALEAEVKQASESLEADFAKFAASKIDEKLETLFFENKEEFFKNILQLQNEFLQDYRTKLSKVETLKQEIGVKKNFAEVEKAGLEFEKKSGVKAEELWDFYAEDLAPRVKKQIDTLSPEKFFEALYEEYKKVKAVPAQGENNPQNQNLPKRIEGSNQALSGTGQTLLTDRY